MPPSLLSGRGGRCGTKSGKFASAKRSGSSIWRSMLWMTGVWLMAANMGRDGAGAKPPAGVRIGRESRQRPAAAIVWQDLPGYRALGYTGGRETFHDRYRYRRR